MLPLPEYQTPFKVGDAIRLKSGILMGTWGEPEGIGTVIDVYGDMVTGLWTNGQWYGDKSHFELDEEVQNEKLIKSWILGD